MWWLLLILCFTLLYLYVKKKFQYFSQLGIPHQPGTFPFGSDVSWKMLRGKIIFPEQHEIIYQEFKNSPIAGYYTFFGSPVFVATHPDMIKKVLIKDFNHFMDKREVFKVKQKYLGKGLISLKGEEWKHTRTLTTPMFTSKILKGLLPAMYQASDEFLAHVAKQDFADLDVQALLQPCVCEMLGQVACGVKPNIMQKDPESNVFYQQLKKLLGKDNPGGRFLRIMLLVFLPKPLLQLLNVHFVEPEVVNWFADIMKNSIKARKESNVKLNDFVDYFVDLEANLDKLQYEQDQYDKDAMIAETRMSKLSPEEKENLVITTAFTTFFAGNDTTVVQLCLVFFYLAKEQEWQEKLYLELRDAIEDNDGNEHLDYAQLTGLKFLEKFVKEAMRNWGIGMIERVCTQDYHIPEMNVTIPKGSLIQIPAQSMMQEDNFFADPQKFDPEAHFEGDTLIPPSFYVFGQGPRNCVGMRFAWLIIRVVLLRVVAHYKILPGPDFPEKFVIDPRSAIGLPKGGVHVKFEARK